MSNSNKILVSVTRQITFTVAVEMGYDFADSGRKFVVADGYSIDTDSLLNAAEAALDIEDDEFSKAAEMAQEAENNLREAAMRNLADD
jgi:hypothetical protein